MTVAEQTLSRTPLYELHVAAGARMVPFAGWEMPVQYEGVIAEHKAVRSSAGMFDVSHMGVAIVHGGSAVDDLQRILSNDITKLTDDGMAQYTLMTNAQGGIEDDLIVYRLESNRFMIVLNAANVVDDIAWLKANTSADTSVEDASADWALIALQGPIALNVLADTLNVELRDEKPFRFQQVDVMSHNIFAATTGYTGESGCELIVPVDIAQGIWTALAADSRVSLCGLAARDTLRLESCYSLHGNDIGPDTSAVAAGLGWVCAWGTDFTGEDVLQQQKDTGVARKLVAIEAVDRAIPRAGYDVVIDDSVVGTVTSGTHSPTLDMGIALAYVDSANAEPGTSVFIDVRGKYRAARIVSKPFYNKESSS